MTMTLKLFLILQIGKHFKGIIQSLNKLYWLGLLLVFFQNLVTYENIFRVVDPKLGFNIEVKYGLLLAIGEEESPDPIEINLYVDKILQVVFQSAKERVVIFSRSKTTVLRFKTKKYLLHLMVSLVFKCPSLTENLLMIYPM